MLGEVFVLPWKRPEIHALNWILLVLQCLVSTSGLLSGGSHCICAANGCLWQMHCPLATCGKVSLHKTSLIYFMSFRCSCKLFHVGYNFDTQGSFITASWIVNTKKNKTTYAACLLKPLRSWYVFNLFHVRNHIQFSEVRHCMLCGGLTCITRGKKALRFAQLFRKWNPFGRRSRLQWRRSLTDLLLLLSFASFRWVLLP